MQFRITVLADVMNRATNELFVSNKVHHYTAPLPELFLGLATTEKATGALQRVLAAQYEEELNLLARTNLICKITDSLANDEPEYRGLRDWDWCVSVKFVSLELNASLS